MQNRPNRILANAVMLGGIALYAVTLLCLVIAGVPAMHATSTPQLVPAIPAPQTLVESHEPLVGFSLNLHHTDQFYRYLAAVDEIAELGCNSIIVLTPVWQEHGESNEVTLISGPGRGPGIDQVELLLNHAKDRGLKTTLMPIVLMTNPREKQWRGRISPSSWHEWWVSYRALMNRFAQLAQRTEVDVFCVGSELLTTESQAARWQSLIDDVRTRYTGSITYSTNWDHYEKTRFWDQVDIIGVNGYWDLTSGGKIGHGDAAALTTRWVSLRNQLYDFSKSAGKPILLTEIGYPSLPWGLRDPWNYVAGDDVPAAPDVQAAGYRAFIAAMTPVLEAKLDITLPDRFTGELETKPSEKQGADDAEGVDASQPPVGETEGTEGRDTAAAEADAQSDSDVAGTGTDNDGSEEPATKREIAAEPDIKRAAVDPAHPSTRGRGEWFTGVYFYTWDPYSRGGRLDRGYGVRGKPAHNLVSDWLAEMHAQLAER